MVVTNDKVDNKDVLDTSGIKYKPRRMNYVGSGIGIYSGDKDMFHNPRPSSKRKFFM